MTVLVLLAVGMGGIVLVGAFVDLERRDRPEVAVALIAGALLVEALLYATQHVVPRGLFRIPVGFSLRLPMVLVPAALLARGLVHGVPRRITPVGAAWSAFALWYATAGVVGVLAGRPAQQVLLEAFTIVYLCGAVALASGVAPERLLRPAVRTRAVLAATAAAVVLIPLSLTSTSFRLPLPFSPVPDFGSWGADATTLVAALAGTALFVEVCSGRRRPLFVGLCLLLLFSPIAGTQRASLANAGVIAVGLFAAAVSATGRRRVRTTATEALIGAGVLTCLGLLIVLPQLDDEEVQVAVVIDNADTVLFGETASRATDARKELWSEATAAVAERPLLGWGLGKQTVLVRPLPFEAVELSAHNIYLDLLLRSGVVGLGLFLAAIGLTLAAGLRTWRRHADPAVAALAAACAVAMAGLLVKGAFESVLEVFRLVTTLGLLAGVVLAAASPRSAGLRIADDHGEPQHAALAQGSRGTTSPGR